jgi:hypothetical protein
VTVPVAAVGVTVAASTTPLPAAVPPAGIVAPFTVAARAVVVVEVTRKLVAPELLAAKAVVDVGAKLAVSESVPIANEVKALLHVLELATVALQVPSVAEPLLKVTVPAATGETVAVSVTLAPDAAVVTVVLRADVRAAFSVVEVAVAVAWALVTAASRNRNRTAMLPQPFRKLVDVARAALRVVAFGVDRLSDI